MNFKFDVYGPYELGRELGSMHLRLREQIEGLDGLHLTIGCYAFCLEHGEKITPWYVGMTTAEKGITFEAFTPHKRLIYSEIIARKRSKPVMFLFPLITQGGNWAKGRSNRSPIEWLEQTLMGMAYAHNPELSNIQGLTYFRTVEVPGLLGAQPRGRRYASENAARQAFLGASKPIERRDDIADQLS